MLHFTESLLSAVQLYIIVFINPHLVLFKYIKCVFLYSTSATSTERKVQSGIQLIFDPIRIRCQNLPDQRLIQRSQVHEK